MSIRVFWGALLVLIGGLFLLSNFGVLPWGIWNTLWRAWPLLLVLFGASILLRPMGRMGALITGLLALVLVGGMVAYAYTNYPGGTAPVTQTLPLDLPLAEGTERVSVDLSFGAGTISLDGTAAADKLAEGSLGYALRKPSISYSGSGADATLDITMASGNWDWVPGYQAPTWTLHLGSKPVWDLKFSTGACKTNLDLSALKVSRLVMETGASESTIIFGDQGLQSTARLSFGAATITIRVPRSVGVKANLSTGLVGTNLAASGFSKSGQDWTSSGYESKTSTLDIRVEAGASSFNVEWIESE